MVFMVKVLLDFQCNLLFVMKSENIEHTSSVAYILCQKKNGDILKSTIIDKLQ